MEVYTRIDTSKLFLKQLERVPQNIRDKAYMWIFAVEEKESGKL